MTAEAGAASDGATIAPTAVRMLGRYQLLAEIARGGMASVHLGRARGMAGFERVVAIKVCHPHLHQDEDFALMFLDEARLAARIHHPNVVATLDVGQDDALFLVMEYIEGDRVLGLLKAALKRGSAPPVDVTLRIMIDALTGLHAAHALCDGDGQPLGVVHRDISPHNILVGSDGVARITDFGIAKAAERATVTRESTVKGKVPYMAPELLEGGAATLRSDVFSSAVVLWEMLTGFRLFKGETEAATMQLVLRGTLEPPSKRNPLVPPELDAVVLKGLERDPANRFASAEAFADALEALPLRAASTRATASYINDVLGEVIGRRRQVLHKLAAGESVADARVIADETHGGSAPSKTWGSSAQSTLNGPAVVVVEDAPPRGSRGRRVAIAALLGVALIAGGAFVARSFVRHPGSEVASPGRAVAPQVVTVPTTVLSQPVTGEPAVAPTTAAATGGAAGAAPPAQDVGRTGGVPRGHPGARRGRRGNAGHGGDDFLPGAI